MAVGTGAVGDVVVWLVVVPVDFVMVELEVGDVVELVLVRSVDGTDVESAVEVLDPMLAVTEDRLAALDVKELAADEAPEATLDTAEVALVVTGATDDVRLLSDLNKLGVGAALV